MANDPSIVVRSRPRSSGWWKNEGSAEVYPSSGKIVICLEEIDKERGVAMQAEVSLRRLLELAQESMDCTLNCTLKELSDLSKIREREKLLTQTEDEFKLAAELITALLRSKIDGTNPTIETCIDDIQLYSRMNILTGYTLRGLLAAALKRKG